MNKSPHRFVSPFVRPSVPILTIKTIPGVPPKYEVEGWEDVNRWANHNCAVWRAITDRTAFAGMSEVEVLKMIAAELLRQNEEYREQIWKAAVRYGPGVFSPNNKGWDERNEFIFECAYNPGP